MYGEPRIWHKLCDTIATIIGNYLTAQVEAGVQAIQVFDSWIGALNPNDYKEFAMPHTSRILDTAKETGVPTIHFGTGTATLLETMAKAGGDVIGADWRIPLDDAWKLIGDDRAIQ